MSDLHSGTRDQLRAFVERVERLEEEKAALAADLKEVYAEAKSMGFDVKTLRTIVRIRKQDLNERQEAEALLETYMIALGMTPSFEPEQDQSGAATPAGAAAPAGAEVQEGAAAPTGAAVQEGEAAPEGEAAA
jgi:uncharacterized protein (UPF0335 family)